MNRHRTALAAVVVGLCCGRWRQLSPLGRQLTRQLPRLSRLAHYTIDVSNLGPRPAANVVLRAVTPVGTSFSSLSAPPGWSCTTPKTGKAGVVTCTRSSLANGTARSFLLTLMVTAKPGDAVINRVARISSDTEDPVGSNNTAEVQTTVTG